MLEYISIAITPVHNASPHKGNAMIVPMLHFDVFFTKSFLLSDKDFLFPDTDCPLFAIILELRVKSLNVST